MDAEFPFHQGRFQGPHRTAPNGAVRRGFHSTKEGFKEDRKIRGLAWVAGFHSTKEGFKASPGREGHREVCPFPFHQGRFQGRGSPTAMSSTRLVSIPPRKVSRRAVGCVYEGGERFPFHQGRFQGPRVHGRRGVQEGVSIPPRKVSRSELK